jgi:iron complex transport system permease protein
VVKKFNFLFVAILILFSLLATGFGAADIGNFFTSLSSNYPESSREIMYQIRIPRIVTAILAGFLMAQAGLVMQRTFLNPLAEPTILGTSAASSLGSVIAIALGVSVSSLLPLFLISAISAALLSFLTLRVVKRISARSLYLIVAGFAFAALANGLIALIAAMSGNSQIRSVSFWTSGTLAFSQLSTILILAPVALATTILVYSLNNRLDLLALGAIQSKLAGYSFKNTQLLSLLIVSVAVASVTVSVGSIAFLGLAAPYLGKALFGESIKGNLVGTGLIGSILLLLSDTLARTLVAPAELPISVLTSLIGAPVLLILIFQQGSKSNA